MIDLTHKRLLGPFVRLNPKDNVLVARADVPAGTAVPEERLVTLAAVAAGHKIAAVPIRKGEPIRKYAEVIGFASVDLPAGTHVHSHNIEFKEFARDYAIGRDYVPVEKVPPEQRATFQGFLRPDGRVGTRNFVAVISTVNCSSTVVRRIADWFTPERLADFPNVDGVAGFAQPLGCGMEWSTGDSVALLRRTVAGYARHPNVAAVLVVGLGCERNDIATLCAAERLVEGPNVRTMNIQELGGTRKTIEAGIAAVKEMLPEANRCRRQTVPASHLTVGLQCGGSDAFSSISANPALGRAIDTLVRHGGTGILSETGEIYGVEHTLTRRAVSQSVGQKLLDRIRWWKEEYGPGRDIQINGVVSPGNNVGGLANIYEKALGSSMKGGTGPLMAVYEYAWPVTSKGLVFMDTPGFDPVSATGQIAGGANLIAFTTGRGSCFGSKPAPTLKLATNTPIFQRMNEDIDLNCGEVVDGTCSLDEMGQRIFEQMLRTASGEKTKSELLGIGDHEFVPWQIGILS